MSASVLFRECARILRRNSRNRTLTWICRTPLAPILLLVVGLLGNAPPAVPVLSVLDAIQSRYDGIDDMTAAFVQTSYTAALARASVSAGTVTMKRPRAHPLAVLDAGGARDRAGFRDIANLQPG